jgi:hypothetical protein
VAWARASLCPGSKSCPAGAQAAAQGQSDPGRLACFYIPGCINHYNWFPEDTGFNYTIAQSHQPLAHHRERFSVLSSLSHIEGRISGHPHPYNFLTGHNINITPGVMTNTVSMDQVAAKYIVARPTCLRSLFHGRRASEPRHYRATPSASTFQPLATIGRYSRACFRRPTLRT